MRNILVIMALAALAAGCSKPSATLPPPLTDAQINEAIDYGQKNAELTNDEFTKDWTVDLGYEQGKGRVTLITPYLRTALLGRQASGLHQKPDRKLVDTALREDAGKIRFRVMLYGDEPDFCKTIKFQLKCNGTAREPIYRHIPPYGEFSRDYYNISSGDVKFDGTGIPNDAKITLVVINTDAKLKQAPVEYAFDLAKYK